MADPYAAGLAMLARRELTSEQVRQKLERKGFGPDAIDSALGRLRDAGALDDERAARLLARRSANLRRHGRRRALREVQGRGIAPELARRAVDAVYDELDEQALLEQELERRSRGPLEGPAAERRLVQQLVRQGFDGAAVLAALRRARIGRP